MPAQRSPQHTPGEKQRYTVGRFIFIFAACVAVAFAIAINLFKTTVLHAEAWNHMGDSTLASVKPIPPTRGEILASDGSILATNLYYYTVMMDLRAESFKIIEFTAAVPELCDSLAKYFAPHDTAAWHKRINAQLDKPKGSRTRNFVLARDVPQRVYDQIRTTFPFFRDFDKSRHTGLKKDRRLKRSYPFGSMARRSIGRVGMTKECSEVHGRSGLEYALDTLLYGHAGVKVRGLSTRGTKYIEDTAAVKGFDVYTTIDITMQDILESELNTMLHNSQAEWGAAMLMEVKTGDIKAISNLELDPSSREPRYIEALNRCVQPYEPGSVMKVMTMAVALEKGFANPNQVYSIGHSYSYLNNRPIRDTHSPGSLPVSRFIEYSSNSGMVKLSMPHYSNDPSQFRRDLAELGFFDHFNTGIAGERPPMVPRDPKLIDLSRMVFGYSTAIPPLYTCAFYNAVANNGEFVRPRLVKGLRTPDGRDSMLEVSYVRRRMMSPENAATLRQMMHGVVWGEGGTAKILRNDAVEIAGKTGTCKIALERPKVDAKGDSISPKTPWKGGYREGHYRVTFCGFFPFDNPKYTCIVVINDPKLPFRGPAVSSGVVLKNTALKLYARSMLNDNPEFKESPRKPDAMGPTVYASFDNTRNATLHNELDLGRTQAIRRPAPCDTAGRVPDVKGVSIREALTLLESKGYAVRFHGVGYVCAQTPEAGTPAGPGTRIDLTLRHD